MTTSPMVDLFADPIRTRLRELTDRAELVDRTQADLKTATTAVGRWRDQLDDRTTTVTQHWHGSAADRFAQRMTGVRHTLTNTAEAFAVAYTVVGDAVDGVKNGHAAVQQLLDEYTTQGEQLVAAALKLLDAGHPTALLDAARFLSGLAHKYAAEADTAVSTTRQTLVRTTKGLAELDTLLPEPKKPKQPKTKHHPKATEPTTHHKTAHPKTVAHHQPTTTHHHHAKPKHHHGPHDGGTSPSSATQVDIGHGLGTVTAPNAHAATAVKAALSQLGVPYVWGGESPGHAFDCSGLTAWAYGKAGISLVHFASSQRVGKRVSEKDLEPGDLVVFSGHVTMYIGKGQVVAAPHTGTDVQIEPLFTSIPGDPFLGFYRPSVPA